MNTPLQHQPIIVQACELPDSMPLAVAGDDPVIADMSERVRQQYIRWNLLQAGDQFVLSFDRVTVSCQDLVLGSLDERAGTPISLYAVNYTNDTESPQTTEFSETKTTTATVSASITSGFKHTQKLSAKISLKKILEIGGEGSLEFSLSSTLGASMSVQQSWSWKLPLVIPARSKVTATAVLSTVHVSVPFHLDVDITVARHPNFDPGYHPLYVGITRNGETTWYRSSLESALNPWLGEGFMRGRDHDHVIYRCRGKFAGVAGRKLDIRLVQSPPKSEQWMSASPTESPSVVSLSPAVPDDQHGPADI